MKFQLNNTGIEDDLLECSLLLISILLKQYKENLIDLNCFKSNTQIKLQYILKNYHKVQDEEKQISITKLLNECTEVNNNANAQK